MANSRLPPVAGRGWYCVLVDNGMFGFFKRGFRPDPERWLQWLARFAVYVGRLRGPADVAVVLPDWLHDPGFTVAAARHPLARRLCRDYTCLAVAHAGPGLGSHARTAEELASLDHVDALAAPLKINCSRRSPRGLRRIVDTGCQRAIVEQVCGVAKKYGLHCHGLGVVLRPEHVARLAALGLTSFDSTSWTRPNPSVVGGASAGGEGSVKDVLFGLALARLVGAGVALEAVCTP